MDELMIFQTALKPDEIKQNLRNRQTLSQVVLLNLKSCQYKLKFSLPSFS